MNLAARPWLLSALLSLSLLSPSAVQAGMTPVEIEQFKSTKAAAEKGDIYGQVLMGDYYREGMGVEKDDEQAVHWYRKASDRNVDSAQFHLGNYYTEGVGVPKDYVEAYAYLNLAGRNYGDARRNLGKLESKMSADQITAGQKRTKELQKEIEAKIAAKKAGK